jgi:hypothetical protein
LPWLAAKAERRGLFMSALGQKQTFASQEAMSALPVANTDVR